jgi:hypothetical protein
MAAEPDLIGAGLPFVEVAGHAGHGLRLGRQISPADLERLVLTHGYARLMTAFGADDVAHRGTQRAPSALVEVEVDQRVNAFAEARAALDEQIARWSPLGAFVVADTSVYIEHEKKLEELDLAALVDAEGDLAPVHLLVPIVVVDELDGLKSKADKPYKRWRAGYTLGVFDRIFAKGTGRACSGPRSPAQVLRYLSRAMGQRPRSFSTRPATSGCRSTTMSWLTGLSPFRLSPGGQCCS